MKGNYMSLDWWMVGLLSSEKGRGGERGGEMWLVRRGVKIAHQHAGVTSVTGCRHHRTDPQNLRKEKRRDRMNLHLEGFCRPDVCS